VRNILLSIHRIIHRSKAFCWPINRGQKKIIRGGIRNPKNHKLTPIAKSECNSFFFPSQIVKSQLHHCHDKSFIIIILHTDITKSSPPNLDPPHSLFNHRTKHTPTQISRTKNHNQRKDSNTKSEPLSLTKRTKSKK
jgi:hypothetical protein